MQKTLSHYLWLSLYFLLFNRIALSVILFFFLGLKKIRLTLFLHRGLWKRLAHKQNAAKSQKPLIWFHTASAGEYLQAKFIIEEIKKKGFRVFTTVTSISGFRWLQREKREKAENNENDFDIMPLDLPTNAKKILNILKPSAIVFTRTDIWPHLKNRAVHENIPIFLICAPQRNTQSAIKKSYYSFLYSGFTTIFTATEKAKKDYQALSLNSVNIEYGGESKFDLVVQRKKERTVKLPFIQKKDTCLLLGSVWPQDRDVILPGLIKAMEEYPNLKLIIAPHEITATELQKWAKEFQNYQPTFYSRMKKQPKSRLLLVDTVGDLFFLYENSSLAYVGGGFTTGIHNILEPAAMANAVIFGPRHKRFPEASEMLSTKAAFCIKNHQEFDTTLSLLLKSPPLLAKTATAASKFVLRNSGVYKKLSQKIIRTTLEYKS